MSDIAVEIRKLANEQYDLANESGRFTVEGVVAALVADLMTRHNKAGELVVRGLIQMASTKAVDAVDKSRTKEDQPTLFEAFDQPVKLGAGSRLARRRMIVDDWSAHLGYIAANMAKVSAAQARENGRFAALSKYLVGKTTTEQAFDLWQKANPGKNLP